MGGRHWSAPSCRLSSFAPSLLFRLAEHRGFTVCGNILPPTWAYLAFSFPVNAADVPPRYRQGRAAAQCVKKKKATILV